MNIIIPIIAIGGVGMAIYESMMEDPRVAENMRIADSLRAEVTKYHEQYDSLLVIANDLNKKVDEQKKKIDSLKHHPPKFKPSPTPPVSNPEEAMGIINELIGK